MFEAAILSILALAAGNYFYQNVQDEPNWSSATERTFFQIVAILVFCLIYS